MVIRVLEVRVIRNTDLRGGVRPLLFQVVGRRHNDVLATVPRLNSSLGEGQRESGFTRAGVADCQEVAGLVSKYLLASARQARRLTGSNSAGAVGVCRESFGFTILSNRVGSLRVRSFSPSSSRLPLLIPPADWRRGAPYGGGGHSGVPSALVFLAPMAKISEVTSVHRHIRGLSRAVVQEFALVSKVS